MAEFLTGKALNEGIYNILWEAKEKLLIVCPYIDFGDYIRESVLNKHKHHDSLHIIIIFGKKLSLKSKDSEFLKSLKNVTVVFVPDLHAKYYANENEGIVTSMNLYEYSLENNIEFGISTNHSKSIIDINNITSAAGFSSTFEKDAWNQSLNLAYNNRVIFAKRPVYKIKNILFTKSKNYIDSEIIVDELNSIFSAHSKKEIKTLHDIPEYINSENNSSRTSKEDFLKSKEPLNIGYCIRTGAKITYNPNKPMCKSAWESWVSWSNWDFPENYCHKTGVPSKGKTSMRNPILK